MPIKHAPFLPDTALPAPPVLIASDESVKQLNIVNDLTCWVWLWWGKWRQAGRKRLGRFAADQRRERIDLEVELFQFQIKDDIKAARKKVTEAYR